MEITLNEKQEQFIATQLASGKFTHADEVVNTALSLLEKLQTEYQDWMAETRSKVEVAVLEMEQGKGLDGETFIAEILNKFNQLTGG